MLVLVAEANEIKLIPTAFKGCPVLITGVGANVLDALKNIDPDAVDMIANFGYCGAQMPIGTTVKIGSDHDCFTSHEFINDVKELPSFFDIEKDVVDMEYYFLKEWCERADVELVAWKTVSDNFNYEQYKENS